MTTANEQRELVTRLALVADQLRGTDALAVLVLLADRLLLGHEHYGPLDLDSDVRCWPVERLAEGLDRAIYTAFEDLQAVRAVGRRPWAPSGG